ncbi:hypothetical protein [Bacillus pinisoli]|uniref:hypothetical protein n=1 Tax=Bacillus pinisoli TaxID=2901866 RepID=UPI001FF1E945|nr:hypothetical protein [Bacillus pinisoli]
MNFVIKAIILALICSGLVFSIYYVGTNLASEKMVNTLSSELEDSGQIEKVIQEIEQDPDLQAYIQNIEQVDETTLPFSTKEQATRTVIKKVGLSELMDIQEQVTSGQMTKEEVLSKLEESLTEEEMLALKLIAYKELQK